MSESTIWIRVPTNGGGEAVYELDRETADTPHYDVGRHGDGELIPLGEVAREHGAQVAVKTAGEWYVNTNTGKAPFSYRTGSPELIDALESAILGAVRQARQASGQSQQIRVARMSRAQRQRYLDD